MAGRRGRRDVHAELGRFPAEGGHRAQLAHKDFFAAHDEVGPGVFGGDFALVEQLEAGKDPAEFLALLRA